MKRARSSLLGHLSIWIRCALVFLCTYGSAVIVRSRIVETALQRSLIEPTGVEASPLMIFGVLLCLYAWSLQRDDLKKKSLPWPNFDQAFPAVLLWGMVMIFSIWISHPSQDIFSRMQFYALMHPEIGAPLIAVLLGIIELLPALPLVLLFFPSPILSHSRKRMMAGSLLLLLYAFGPVLEAAYYRLVGPPLIHAIRTIIALMPGTQPVDLNRWEIGYGTFKVTLGYACTDFSALILFIGLFGLVWWRMAGKHRINHGRAITALLGGILSLWILNILRITSIVMIGAWHPTFALTLFHSAVGIVIFLIFFLAYVKVVLPMVVTSKKKRK